MRGALVAAVLAAGPLAAGAVPVVVPTVVAVHPHDPGAFTEGLLYRDGLLYESTGTYGASTVRRVDPTTGAIRQWVALPASEFGEGMALVGEELRVLTYVEEVGHVYDRASLAHLGTFAYSGQGWGLSFDGTRLVMSNGSSVLWQRDPATFEVLGSVGVTRDGAALGNLNELECVGELVYANVWLTDTIARIDARTGVVLTEIDASGLLTPPERQAAGELNGIAFDPATRHFFLTGKFWPKVFEVTLPVDPYGEPPCDPGNLAVVARVRLTRDGAGGVAVAWDPDPSARSYHVNAVGAAADLAGARPHRPELGGGVGEARCDASWGATSCADRGALADPRALLLYQVFSACGSAGIDEGP